MGILKTANLLLSFLLELAALVAFGYWGFHLHSSVLVQWLVGIGLPLVVAVLWGIFMAPNSATRLPNTAVVVIAFAVFLLAALALYASKQTDAALVVACFTVANIVFKFLFKQ